MKTLLSMSLAGSAAILVVLAMRVLLRKAPKIFSYGLWAVVLFRLLCPVGIPVRLPVPAEPTPVQTETLTNIKTVEHRTAVQPEEKPIPVQKQTEEIRPVTPAQPKIHRLSPEVIVTGIWILGASVTFLAGAFQYLRFRRTLTGACRVAGNLYQADHIGSAFAVGLFRPKIYIPSDLLPSEIPYILAHERHHIRRGDPVVRHLAFAALCLHWFNPLVWVAFVLSGKDMEMSCDEAVIRKFGESARADYASSLLNLAMGKSILSGAPIAFGEGNTKKRIQNLIAWKPQKRSAKVLWLAVCLCATLLCACQPAPKKGTVVSKNDGEFEQKAMEISTETGPGEQKNISFHDQFTSADERVEFTFNIDQTIANKAFPVVEVVPHFLTAEDAQRVASCLFGEIDFFEADPLLSPCYTKEEIQTSIQRWSHYTNSEAMSELLGENDDFTIEGIKAKIEELNTLYESAPVDSSRTPCKWSFQKESVYTYSPQEVISMDTSFDNDAIKAVCEVNGIRYRYEVVTGNMGDDKLNMISAYLDGSRSPMSIDENIYRAALTRTPAPTDDQIAAVTSKVMDMLQRMDLGEWQIDQCNVRALGEDIMEYAICIDAVPVIHSMAVAQQPQLPGFTSDAAYSSNSEASFEFSANGDLLKFTMYSPIDGKIVNENVPTMRMDNLLEKAKQYLSLSDSDDYGLQDTDGVLKEPLDTSVIISNIGYGLLREKVPNTDDSYYYLPGFVLYGVVENVGSETQHLYFQSEEPYPIVVLNAVDGSVIE